MHRSQEIPATRFSTEREIGIDSRVVVGVEWREGLAILLAAVGTGRERYGQLSAESTKM